MVFEGSVPNGWKLVKLSDLGEVNRGKSKHRPRDAAFLYGGSYPFIQTGDVKASDGRITSYNQTYSEAGLKQSRLWPSETMCITIAANIAETGILTFPACFPDSIIGFIADKKQCDVFFIEYLFRLLKRRIQAQANGSVQDNINLQTLERIIFPVPEIRIQKNISYFLKKLDDKIILNKEINQTLEQMSQTLFKSWFVDFDPVIDNALDAGNPIPEALRSRAELRQKVRNSADFKPLPANIRALFPTEFEEMELGLIPKGWKFSNVGSLLKNTIGGDWGSDSEDEKHTTQAMIVRGTDIPELISGKLSSAPYRWVEPKKLEKRRINVGDIIIEVSGGSPTQSTGRSIFMTEQIIDRLGGVVEPASFCRKFEPLSVELGLIISLHLSKIYNDGKMWEYQNQSTGIANFQTKYFLEAEQIVIPSAQVINAFYRIVMPWIDKSHNNEQIILGNLRDTLLPKLISGELSLEDLPDLVTQTEPA
ncbi:restriction endonuclease subunit S [Klebsiella michiganensis]|uniref:restriction endonuclease subunit S n=1 Tax=Klebsiella michiganensis TaxID=1134687 RepID=UPI0029493EBA|nr:restriction endonuclease subunit S [Klebsiella michiganensis]